MNLDGRSALVTGAAGGLGGATVRRLVDVGMGVAIFDRDADRAAALAKELGDAAVAVGGDVNADDDVAAAIDAGRSLGTLSVVVNVAGGGVGGGRTIGRDGTPHDKAAFVGTMEFALLVESIARNAYLNGENVRLDGALRFPPK